MNESEVLWRKQNLSRMHANAGIAIGPILFIIAILGILAAAIAAGSGSFTTSTTADSDRTKAAALIDIGQNIKVGMDRIIGEGTDFNLVDINASNTSAANTLFSPIGGGVAAPSVTMSLNGTSTWYYPLIAAAGIGTSYGSRYAVIEVSLGVCNNINTKANGVTLPAGAALGDFTAAPLLSPTWPATLRGKSTGCIDNYGASGTTDHYYFYQVIGID